MRDEGVEGGEKRKEGEKETRIKKKSIKVRDKSRDRKTSRLTDAGR